MNFILGVFFIFGFAMAVLIFCAACVDMYKHGGLYLKQRLESETMGKAWSIAGLIGFFGMLLGCARAVGLF